MERALLAGDAQLFGEVEDEFEQRGGAAFGVRFFVAGLKVVSDGGAAEIAEAEVLRGAAFAPASGDAPPPCSIIRIASSGVGISAT